MALKNTVDYFAEDDEEKKDATEEATEVSKTPIVDYFAEEEIPEEREEETAIEAKQIDYFAEDDDVSLDEPTYKLNPKYADAIFPLVVTVVPDCVLIVTSAPVAALTHCNPVLTGYGIVNVVKSVPAL